MAETVQVVFPDTPVRYVVPEEIKKLGDKFVACRRQAKRQGGHVFGTRRAVKLEVARIRAERKFWLKILDYYPELKLYPNISYNPNTGCVEIDVH